MTLVDGPGDNASEVTVWSLEITDRAKLEPVEEPAVKPVLLRAARPAPELSRFFYRLVGAPWQWVDRRDWTDDDWRRWVDRSEHHLTTCWVDGVPAGYYELEQQGTSVEVAYFGLTTTFIGQGLGRWLLSKALADAWDLRGPADGGKDVGEDNSPGTRTERVWLHTCSLDGPAALANYQARGLEIFDQSSEWRLIGPSEPGPGPD